MTRFFALICFALSSFAQTTAGTIQAQGSATIYVQPDQAQLMVTVTTTGTTAQAAGAQNATVTQAVTSAINKIIGSKGTIQTVSYNVWPNYSNPTPNQPATILGYSATNMQQVTLTDLTLIGAVIDAANQAGATGVGSLTLGLQNPEPTLQAALAAAAKQAVTHAGAIAGGLGGKTGAVLSAMESTSYAPLPVFAAGASATATTITPGPVSVSATVTVTVQLQ
jgi:uncharacterized protein YggE